MAKKELAVNPGTISMPLESTVIVSGRGFEPGALVVVGFPWAGTPDSHSVISYNVYADSNGVIAFQAPDPAFTLNLAPGDYRVAANVWDQHGDKWVLAKGPNAELIVE